ncbi:hypothetical protein DE4585_03872 [Mycobacteroides salmoniphilum]|uniref:Uncharacterized protein n=1 Tax=Mycobacteroides salmoniphilum TaxID=404941 RepID=A0A4R8RZY6_9MYCO|nr:hypothetical protein [Mycobacteroides salmoniphilum]TDZ80121.1 hypothetical protein DE4585_03872 [Mycobacteroides salmoniphilum]
MTAIDPAAIWRALPKDLQTDLRKHKDETLSDDLLRRCGHAVDERDVPVFWRPDPDTAFTRHRLHPDLARYLATH